MIFLFHAQEDEEVADIIREELSVFKEVKVWAENDNLASPPERTEAMREDITNAEFQIIVFSKSAFQRRRPRELLLEFQNVINFIKEESIKHQNLIPIRIDECMLPLLEEHFPHHNLFEEGGLEQIVRVITKTQHVIEEKDEYLDGELNFYKNNWKWIIRFQDEEMIGDHRFHTGFAYLHFILNSDLSTVSIDQLKKVTSKLHRPKRYELLDLDEDWEKIEPNPPKRTKEDEELRADVDLFRQIRDEIIYAIQSMPAGKIRDFFMGAVKFGGDEYIIYNPFRDSKMVKWKLYARE